MEKQNLGCLGGSMASPMQAGSNSAALSSKISINQHHPTFSLLWSLHQNPHYQEFVTTQQSCFRDWSKLKLMQQNLKFWHAVAVLLLSCPYVFLCCLHLFCKAPGEETLSVSASLQSSGTSLSPQSNLLDLWVLQGKNTVFEEMMHLMS